MSESDRHQYDAELQALLRAEILALRAELAQRDAEINALMHGSDEKAITRAIEYELNRDAFGWLRIRLRRLRHRLALRRQAGAVAVSEYFDSNWYAEHVPECDGPDNAVVHYLKRGAFAGLDPSPGFSTNAYYRANPDVAAAGWPALAHYVLHGKAEGRRLGSTTGG